MNIEYNRLSSFRHERWAGFNTREMAACGLYATGINDVVSCEFCDIMLYNWDHNKRDRNYRAIHYRGNPDCPFFINHLSTSDVPLDVHIEREKNFENVLIQAPYYGVRRTVNYFVMKKQKSDEDLMVLEKLQYYGVGSREISATQALLSLTERRDSSPSAPIVPTVMDRFVFQLCKMSIATIAGTANIDPDTFANISVEYYYLVDETDNTETYALQYIQNVKDWPRHAGFMAAYLRRETFIPITNIYTSMQMDQMALAGLFYNDKTKLLCCFYCNITFEYFNFKLAQPSEKNCDLVWKHHAAWSPWCKYVLMSRGCSFVWDAGKTLSVHVTRAQTLSIFGH